MSFDIEFHDNGKPGLYAAEIEGARAKLTFADEGDGVIALDPRFALPEWGGPGIAAALMDRAVEDARANELKIRPPCSYVETAFKNVSQMGRRVARISISGVF